MSRGNNLYHLHLEEIAKEVSHARVAELKRGQLKGKACLYLEPLNPRKISDIGNVLAYLSARAGMLNLAIMAMKKEY